MNLCKVILAQSKAMKLNWSTACGGGAGCVRFHGAKKRPSEGKDLNALVVNALKAVLNRNKYLKAKASIDSSSEDEQENFNSENLKIGEA